MMIAREQLYDLSKLTWQQMGVLCHNLHNMDDKQKCTFRNCYKTLINRNDYEWFNNQLVTVVISQVCKFLNIQIPFFQQNSQGIAQDWPPAKYLINYFLAFLRWVIRAQEVRANFRSISAEDNASTHINMLPTLKIRNIAI